MAIEITTSGKWIKIVDNGNDPVYYSDRRAVVSAYSETNRVYVRPMANEEGGLTIDATAANTLNGVALPTNAELLAQKLLDEVFFLDKKGVNPKMGIEFFTHCLNSGQDGSIVFSNTGTGSSNGQSAVSGNRQGVIAHTTGTTTTGRAFAQTAATAFAFGGGAWYMEGDIKTTGSLSDATDSYQILFGFGDTSSASNQVDGVYFLYDSQGVSTGSAVSGNWQIATSANSVRTFSTSSVAVAANTWYRLRIEINAAGTSAAFYINDALVGTITTNIPTGSSRTTGYLCMIIKSAGTLSRSMDHDWSYGYNVFTTPS